MSHSSFFSQINPNKEADAVDEIVEREALAYIFGQVMEALEAKRAYEESQKKEGRKS